MALTVYSKLTSENEFFTVLKDEIGLKTSCIPFCNKVIDAFKTLPDKMNEAQCRNAANVFLSGMQTLIQGGILPEDYDKIDFVKRGYNTIVPSARVEAFYRAAGRKGYRITDTIIPVPKDDFLTTYFEEQFYNGEIIYTLKDLRKQPDRKYSAERIAENYFSKYICRLNIYDIRNKVNIPQIVVEMTNEELINISNVSDQGIFNAKWVDRGDGSNKKKRVVYDTLNKYGFWYLWTRTMVEKTMVRQALRRVKEVLPELKETIYAFEQDEETPQDISTPQTIDIPIEEVAVKNLVDLKNLTDAQKQDCFEMLEVYKANPKLAQDTLKDILNKLETGIASDEIINEYYASIMCFKDSKKSWPLLEPYLGGEF